MSRSDPSSDADSTVLHAAEMSCGPDGCEPADLGDLLGNELDDEESPVIVIQGLPLAGSNTTEGRPLRPISDNA